MSKTMSQSTPLLNIKSMPIFTKILTLNFSKSHLKNRNMQFSSIFVAASALFAQSVVSSPVPVEISLQLRTKLTTFHVSVTFPVLTAHPHFLVSDDASTSPNQYGILVHDYFIENVPVSGNWTLTSTHHLTDYRTRYAQQDPGQTSEWVWVDTAANIKKNG